jgi:hypothetical protein
MNTSNNMLTGSATVGIPTTDYSPMPYGGVCPHCGRCTHCGHGGGYTLPGSTPTYPYQPYTQPTWTLQTGQATTTMPNVTAIN